MIHRIFFVLIVPLYGKMTYFFVDKIDSKIFILSLNRILFTLLLHFETKHDF